MARRYRPEKRDVDPDLRYQSVHVSMFINRLMHSGKKSTAERLFYDSMDMIEERTNRPGIEIFDEAMQNVAPHIEVRPRRVGGSTYQVPIEVAPDRRITLAMRWLIAAARNRGGKSMASKLANEFMDAATKQGAAVKRREDTHRMAEANRAFAHYRF
ncbi:MAG: 30S ribosomal protein S7 [Anaerolineales bacterium]|nr:30S ribosomal protein S7 [Anaerolineales bacterium]MCB8954220.1 30S ribosomal protein S7 [Ardenticatenales bacterium]